MRKPVKTDGRQMEYMITVKDNQYHFSGGRNLQYTCSIDKIYITYLYDTKILSKIGKI